MGKSSDTSQKVMDRILYENRWAVPAHEHKKTKGANKFRSLSLLISILFLVGISVSFIYINPYNPDNEKYTKTVNESIEATINTTDFAKTYSNLGFLSIQEGRVEKISEPLIYRPNNNENKTQLFWMLAILGISMITLFMSWISGEDRK